MATTILTTAGRRRVTFVPADTTWTVPAGVTSVDVIEARASGGGGGGGVVLAVGSGGGGGGFAQKLGVAVNPGDVLNVQVGIGGGGGAAGAGGTAGQATWFLSSATVNANGGAGGNPGAGVGGNGAGVSGGAGTVGDAGHLFSGGNSASSASNIGGGGGGGAGDAGNGGAASGNNGGTGGTAGGGAGGTGTVSVAGGGVAVGGGGAGGSRGNVVGGNGANGSLIIEYTEAGAVTSVAAPSGQEALADAAVVTSVAGPSGADSLKDAGQVKSVALRPYRGLVVKDGASLFWPLDDSGSTLIEEIAGANGSAFNTQAQRAGILQEDPLALGFVAASTPFTILTGQFDPSAFTVYTLELWVYMDPTNTARQELLNRYHPATTTGTLVGVDASGNLFAGIAPSLLTVSAAITRGAWHHVMAVFSTTNIRIFLDGALAATATGNGIAAATPADAWVNGSLPGVGGNYLTGKIQAVGFYPSDASGQAAAHYAQRLLGGEALVDAGAVTSIAVPSAAERLAESATVTSAASLAAALEVLVDVGSSVSAAVLSGGDRIADAGSLTSVALPSGQDASAESGTITSVAVLAATAERIVDSGLIASVALLAGAEAGSDAGLLTSSTVLAGADALAETALLTSVALPAGLSEAVAEQSVLTSVALLTQAWQLLSPGLSGVAYDETGTVVIPGVEVIVFRDDTNTPFATLITDAAGAWACAVDPGLLYWISYWLAGSPDTMGRTDKGIAPTLTIVATGT